MYYNTKLIVKYYGIEQELLAKCKANNESEYTEQDVLDICDKLYRDELLSAFSDNTDIANLNIEETLDQINVSFKKLYYENLIHTEFKELIDCISNTCFEELIKDNSTKDTIEQIVLTGLFSHQLFHLAHTCICQQLDLGKIEIASFNMLKQSALKLFLNF